MIQTFFHFFGRGYTYVRNHPQLLMTMLLIVVIPIAFLVSGQQFLSAARDNQERLEKDRIGIIHDIFAAFITAAQFNTDVIQREIEHVVALNPDVTEFIIAREEPEGVRILASFNTEHAGTLVKDEQAFRLGNINPDESIITPFAKDGVRFWKSIKLIQGPQNEDYYIYLETSLRHIDELFAARIMTAYVWLIGILAIVLILVVRHVRLIDYAYLYTETKKANEMKDLFTNMIAHELRAPLTAMRGYASMIREQKGIDLVTLKNATEIENASGRLIVIVSDLLDAIGSVSKRNEIEPGVDGHDGLFTASCASNARL